jgi:hypothetical protein
MKKVTFFSAVLILSAIIFLNSCQKNNYKNDSKIDKPTEYFSKKFLKDSVFNDFFKTAITNSFKIGELFSNYSNRRTSDGADTTAAYDYVAEIVTAEVLLLEENPAFFELSLSEQQQVITNVCDTIADDAYRLTNPTDELVLYCTETWAEIVEHGPPQMGGRTGRLTLQVTWTEFMGCTTALLGATLSAYGGVVGDVWGLVTGTAMTWGNIWNIAKALVRNTLPWWQVIGGIVMYAGCLWAAA